MLRAFARRARADIRRHPLHSVLTLLVLAAATGTITVGAVVQRSASGPYDRLFSQTNGAHVTYWADPSVDLGVIGELEGVVESAGPIPYVFSEGLVGDAERHEARFMAAATPPEVARPLLVEGDWLAPGRDDQIVLERSLAEAVGARVGESVEVETPAGSVRFDVAGIVVVSHRGPYPNWRPGTTYVAPAALDVIDPLESERYVWSAVRLADPEMAPAFLEAAAAAADGPVFPQTAEEVRRGILLGTQINVAILGVFGVFALGAAALIIANTISGRVVAQYREIGVLKATGFTPRQVTAMLVGQYLLIGLVAVVLGFAASLLLAAPLLSDIARAMRTAPPSLHDPALLVAIALGVQALVAASTLVPAVRGGRISAVQAIRSSAGPSRARSSRLAAAAARLRLPPVVVLGARDAFAKPLRSIRTVVALALTVITVVFALGLRATIDLVIADPARVGSPADAFVYPGEVPAAEVERLLDAEPGIASRHVWQWERAVLDDGSGFWVKALDGDYRSAGYTLREGRLLEGPGEAVVGYGLRQRLGLELGDSLTLRIQRFDETGRPAGASQPLTLEVVGQSMEWDNDGLIALTDVASLSWAVQPGLDATHLVRFAEEHDPQAVAAALTAASGGALEVELWDATLPEEVVLFRTIVTGLMGVLVGIGMVNLLSTTLLSVRERRRDFGVVKTLGLSPLQVTGVVSAGAIVLALIAVAIGAPLGVAIQRALFDAIGVAVGIGPGFGASPSLWMLLLLAPAAAAASAAAVALPARQAARMSPAAALRAE